MSESIPEPGQKTKDVAAKVHDEFFEHCDAWGRAINGSPRWDAACMKELNTTLKERMSDDKKEQYCATMFGYSQQTNRDFGEYTACDADKEYDKVKLEDKFEPEIALRNTYLPSWYQNAFADLPAVEQLRACKAMKSQGLDRRVDGCRKLGVNALENVDPMNDTELRNLDTTLMESAHKAPEAGRAPGKSTEKVKTMPSTMQEVAFKQVRTHLNTLAPKLERADKFSSSCVQAFQRSADDKRTIVELQAKLVDSDLRHEHSVAKLKSHHEKREEQLKSQIEQKKDQNSTLKEALEQNKDQNSTLKEALEQKKAQNSTLEKALEQKKDQISTLKEALEQKKAQNSMLREALVQNKGKISEREKAREQNKGNLKDRNVRAAINMFKR